MAQGMGASLGAGEGGQEAAWQGGGGSEAWQGGGGGEAQPLDGSPQNQCGEQVRQKRSEAAKSSVEKTPINPSPHQGALATAPEARAAGDGRGGCAARARGRRAGRAAAVDVAYCAAHRRPFDVRLNRRCAPLSPRPYSLLPTPYSLHPTPYTLHPTPDSHNAKAETLKPLFKSSSSAGACVLSCSGCVCAGWLPFVSTCARVGVWAVLAMTPGPSCSCPQLVLRLGLQIKPLLLLLLLLLPTPPHLLLPTCSRFCEAEGCTKLPTFGSIQEGKPRRCAQHRLAVYSDVRNPRCIVELGKGLLCNGRAHWADVTDLRPVACTQHRKPHFVDILHGGVKVRVASSYFPRHDVFVSESSRLPVMG